MAAYLAGNHPAGDSSAHRVDEREAPDKETDYADAVTRDIYGQDYTETYFSSCPMKLIRYDTLKEMLLS